MAHARVDLGREQEGDARLDSHGGEVLGLKVQGDTEAFHHVRRAGAGGGRRATTVFDNSGAGGGDDDRRHGRDVDRVRAVSAGTGDVQYRSWYRYRGGGPHERVDEALDLRRGLPLDSEPDQNGGQPHRRGVAANHLPHDPGCLAAAQVTPGHQPGHQCRP